MNNPLLSILCSVLFFFFLTIISVNSNWAWVKLPLRSSPFFQPSYYENCFFVYHECIKLALFFSSALLFHFILLGDACLRKGHQKWQASPLDTIPKQSWTDYILYIYHWCCLVFHHLRILGRYSDALTYICFFSERLKKRNALVNIPRDAQTRTTAWTWTGSVPWFQHGLNTVSKTLLRSHYNPRQIPKIARWYTESVRRGAWRWRQSEESPAGPGSGARPPLARSRRLGSGAANDDVTENTICQPLSHCLRSLFLGRLLF